MTTPAGPVLRIQPEAPQDGSREAAVRVAVADPTWTAPAARGDRAPGSAVDGARGSALGTHGSSSLSNVSLSVRDAAEAVLAARDVMTEAWTYLDAWVATTGVVAAMTVDGTSYWHRDRLGAWLWLEEAILATGIVDALVAAAGPSAIEVAAGVDDALAEAARRVAARDGLGFRDARVTGPALVAPVAPGRAHIVSSLAAPVPPPSRTARTRLASFGARLRHRLFPDVPVRRARVLRRRLADLGRERPGRLLVLLAAAPQRVDTPSGSRLVNAYLGPVVDRLRGSALEPVELELRTSYLDDAGWARLGARDGRRRIPGDLLRLLALPGDAAAVKVRTAEVAAKLDAISTPVLVDGVDLGPELAARVAKRGASTLRGMLPANLRAARLLQELRPAGVLLADEYHRQDWTGAAMALGIPTAAIQHGIIHAVHPGYVHPARPTGLRLPARTYVFGRWERDLLVDRSVYLPGEVVVGGSPRLGLAAPSASAVDRDAVRVELGISPGDRMVVVSGTWGAIGRRFLYPIVLAGILDRPLRGVHLVVKLHPGEPDEGPYRAVIEGAAASRGFAPPPVTVVRHVDLYRLLAAADAHLGVHSTVLTEAVAAGTLNLLADRLLGSDLLGYVEAGVAVPVRDGGDVLAALERRSELVPGEDARRAFLDAHFEPGDAAGRIADDLVGWLA